MRDPAGLCFIAVLLHRSIQLRLSSLLIPALRSSSIFQQASSDIYYGGMFSFPALERLKARLPSRRTRLTVLVLLFFILMGILGTVLYRANGDRGISQQEIEQRFDDWLMK